MKICEHCGAPVYGDVCEYCDMPAKKPAPPKAEYKPENPHKTLKMPVRKHSVKKKKKNKKFLRKALLCIFALSAISGIGSALSNRNSNTVYIQQPAERTIEYNGNHYDDYNNNYYYDDDYYDDDDYDDDYDDYDDYYEDYFEDDDDYDEHHDDEHH